MGSVTICLFSTASRSRSRQTKMSDEHPISPGPTPRQALTYCEFRQHGDDWLCSKCGRSVACRRKPNAVCKSHAASQSLLREMRMPTIAAKPLPPAVRDRVRVMRAPKAAGGGPGAELKKLLKLVGITASPNCSCNARAATMDVNGCDWCEANIDTIVGWLREEATKRTLPFVDMAGRLLVRRAIRNARKAAS
jgi:hypothetical protein